ncbi:MAG: hypothetical protein KGL39_12935 [Patescibacteria group bacterium]|nr:hypothetical protein [Patescibacteria group bacterium]
MLDRPPRPHGSFKTKYDVPERKPPAQLLRHVTEQHIEAGDVPDPREPYVDMLSSVGWDLAMRFVVLPYVGKIRQALLKQVGLPDEERHRLQGSLATIERLVEELYKRAQEKVPEGVASAFR